MEKISEHKIGELSNLIKNKFGIYYPKRKHDELILKINELAKENNYRNTDDFINVILKDNNNLKITESMVCKLTIGETHFFRDEEFFKAIKENILPELISKKQKNSKNIRIWSAGCSSGEEAYSIAIILKEIIERTESIDNWQISILATDINQKQLNKAKRGIYSDWSFRGTKPEFKEYYFDNYENYYIIDESLLPLVNFSYLNLITDVYPSFLNNTTAMDLILCRHVLMYFSQEDIIRVSNNFFNCLVEDGILITSPSESYNFLSKKFSCSNIGSISTYIKTSKTNCKKTIDKKTITPNEKFKKINYRTNQVKKKIKQKPINEVKAKLNKKNENNPFELYNKGKYLEAQKTIKKIPNYLSNNSLLLLLTRINANMGHLQEALYYCNQAINICKINPITYYLKASINIESGEIRRAYANLKKGLFLNPNYIVINFTLGNVSKKLNLTKEAKKHFSNTLKLLNDLNEDDVIPESEGILAGKLTTIVKEILNNTL